MSHGISEFNQAEDFTERSVKESVYHINFERSEKMYFAKQSLDQSRRGRSSGFSTGTDDNDIEHLDNGEADISTGNLFSCSKILQ